MVEQNSACALAAAAFFPPAGRFIKDEIDPVALGAHLSCVRIVGIWIEELLAADLKVGNRALPLRGYQPVNELLSKVRLHMRVLAGVYQHHAILIEKALVAFDEDGEIAVVLEGKPSPAVGKDISI